MTYGETLQFLYGLRLFGTKLGLENTFALAALAGNPQDHLRFIHVAGTNGKGSVCAILESIYRHHRLRVGLFTSPHLVTFTERIQVDRTPISEEDVARLTEQYLQRLGADPEQWPFRPTFFEFVTVLALTYFREHKCDLVIWETGMGGRLDATNIVTPLAAVITNVQYDHQQWLGNTLPEIAREKAGIIKPDVPTVTGATAEALDVVTQTARTFHGPLTVVHPPHNDPRLQHLSLLGEHQKQNAAIALATVDALAPRMPVPAAAIEQGLARTQWPGRLQLIQHRGTPILLDGAHNPDGAATLAHALRTHFPGQPVTLLLGLLKDKAWETICDILVPQTERTFLVPVPSERTADPEVVQHYCHARWPDKELRTFPSLPTALEAARQKPFVVVAGSLLLVGEAMEVLGLATSARGERDLNEWDASRQSSARHVR